MNYSDIVEHPEDFDANRMILTHMDPMMFAHVDTVLQDCAYDGLVVSI